MVAAAAAPDDVQAQIPATKPSVTNAAERPVFSRVFARGWAIAAISTAGLLAFGGAAYAGVLPAPIQNAVAGAARSVGVQLPSPARANRMHSDVGRKAASVGAGQGVAGTVGTADASRTATGTVGLQNGSQGDASRSATGTVHTQSWHNARANKGRATSSDARVAAKAKAKARAKAKPKAHPGVAANGHTPGARHH
jgi:hypothetical protein